MADRLILIRHGETEWSRLGRHTGRTDLALTDEGRAEAELVAPSLPDVELSAVFSSPLQRALETARLAGFEPTLDADLMEWDYGEVEGLRNEEIVASTPGWSKWMSVVPGGEQVADVGARADRFLATTADLEGNVLLFAHGHLLSILIARWLGFDATEGRRFPLATATLTILGTKRSDTIVETFNQSCRHVSSGEVSRS